MHIEHWFLRIISILLELDRIIQVYNDKNNLQNYSCNLNCTCAYLSVMQHAIRISEFFIIYIFFLQKAIQQRLLGKSSLTHDEEREELNANQPGTTTEVSTD